MLSQETRDNLERLPWRGPVEPVMMDAPDSLQPRMLGVNRVRIFDMDDAGDVEDYARILNRDDRNVARIRATQTSTTPAGGFRIMLAWTESYMCASSYIPAEGRAVLRSSTVAAADIDDDGVEEGSKDEERTLKDAVRLWARESSKPPMAPDGDGDEAGTEDGGEGEERLETKAPLDFDDGVAAPEETAGEEIPEPDKAAGETRKVEKGGRDNGLDA